MDEHIVISIARQYGSGGRTVGKMLAEKLGISFYDKEIIRMKAGSIWDFLERLRAETK